MRKKKMFDAVQVRRVTRFFDRNAVLLLVLAGALLRAWKLGSIPGGLNQDEASGIYDAWALLNYGIDSNGFHNPMMFVSWGPSMHVLSYYLTIPFLWLFNFSSLAVRIPPFLVSVLSLPLFYIFTRKMTDRSTALIALFLLVIAPWHFMIARWNHESCFLASFLLAGVTLFALRRPLWAAVVFGLTIYVYGPALFIAPVLFGLILLVLFLRKSLSGWTAVAAGLTFSLITQPMLMFLLINKFHFPSMTSRFLSIPLLPTMPHYDAVTAMHQGFVPQVFSNLATLGGLLVGQEGSIWNEVPGFGFLYLFSTAFFLVGALLFFLKRYNRTPKSDAHVLMILWVFACLLLAAVMPVNTNRINVLFYPLTIFIALCLQQLRHVRVIVMGFLCLYAVTAISFFHAYFTSYAGQMSASFHDSFIESITYAKETGQGTICIDTNVSMAYVYALIADRTNPYSYLTGVQYIDPNKEFREVQSFDRYVFAPNMCGGTKHAAYILDGDIGAKKEWGKDFTVTQFTHFTVAVRRSQKNPLISVHRSMDFLYGESL